MNESRSKKVLINQLTADDFQIIVSGVFDVFQNVRSFLFFFVPPSIFVLDKEKEIIENIKTFESK